MEPNPDPGIIRRLFDQEADRYDEWFEQNQDLFLRQAVLIRSSLGDHPGHILEIGCGPGRFAAALGIGCGIDPSCPFIRKTVSRGVPAVCGCGEYLPFRPGHFSRVLLITVLEFVSRPDRILQECCRILKPGGRVIIGGLEISGDMKEKEREKAMSTFRSHLRYLPREVLTGEITRAGLSVLSIIRGEGILLITAGQAVSADDPDVS